MIDWAKNRCLVLMSGGVESAACAIILQKTFRVEGLFLRYSQINAGVERVVVLKQCSQLSIPLYQETLPALWPLGKDLYKSNEDAYVPLRNTLFLTIGAAIAARKEIYNLAFGFAEWDKGVFFDNSFAHHSILEGLLSASLGRKITIHLPVQYYTKTQLVKICDKAGVSTVSCWNARHQDDGSVWTCGECLQCKEVEKARGDLRE